MLLHQVSPFDCFEYKLTGDTVSKKIIRNGINTYFLNRLSKEHNIDDSSIANIMKSDKSYVDDYKNYKRDKESSYKNDEKAELRRIYKKIRKTNREIIKHYCSIIDNKCNYFITLTFSKLVDGYEETKVDYDAKREVLAKFLRKIIRKTHNKSWFLIVVGNGDTMGIHFHIYAYIPNKRLRKVKRVINKIWSETYKEYWVKTINKYRDKYEKKGINKPSDVLCKQANIITNNTPSKTENCTDESLLYAVSPEKNEEYKKLDGIIGKSKRYSIKNKPAIKKCEIKKFKLSYYENEELCNLMVEYLEKNKPDDIENTMDCVTQLMKANGMVSFIPYDVLLGFFDKIIKNRKGKSLKDMLIIQAEKIIKLKNKSSRGGKSWSEI